MPLITTTSEFLSGQRANIRHNNEDKFRGAASKLFVGDIIVSELFGGIDLGRSKEEREDDLTY